MSKASEKPAIAASNIPTIENICNMLGINKSQSTYQTFTDRCYIWKGNYSTAKGVRGTDLVDWKLQSVRQELQIMSTKFLEAGFGEEFWPVRQRNINSGGLTYPTDKARITDLLSQLFVKQNMYKRRNSTYPRPKAHDRGNSKDPSFIDPDEHYSSREPSLAYTDDQIDGQHQRANAILESLNRDHGKSITNPDILLPTKQLPAKPRKSTIQKSPVAKDRSVKGLEKSSRNIRPRPKTGNAEISKVKGPDSITILPVGKGAGKKRRLSSCSRSDVSQAAEEGNTTSIWELRSEDEVLDDVPSPKRRKAAHKGDAAKTPPSKRASGDGRSPEVRSSRRKRNQTTKVQDTVPSATVDEYIDESQDTMVDARETAGNVPEIPSTMDSPYVEGSQETTSDKTDADGDIPESSLEIDGGIGLGRSIVRDVRRGPTQWPLRTAHPSHPPQPDTLKAPSSHAFQPPALSLESNIVKSFSNVSTDRKYITAPVAQMITSSAEERYRQPDLGISESCKSPDIPIRLRELTTTPAAEEKPLKRNQAPSASLEPPSVPTNKSQLTFWLIKSRTPKFHQSKWAKGTLRGQTMHSMIETISKIMRSTCIESLIFQLQTAGKTIEYTCEKDDETEFEKMKSHFQDEMKEAIRKDGNQRKAFEIFIEPVVEDENSQIGLHDFEDAGLDEFF